MRNAGIIGFCVALAACLLLTVVPAAAENLGPGGGSRVIVGDQVVGDYQLWVTTSPEPVQTGILTIDVRVTDPKTGQRVTDADVQIELSNPEDGTRLQHPATHRDAGNPIDYAAHIEVPAAGSWSGVLRVTGAAGSSQVNFVVPVLSPRSSGTLVMLGLPFLAIVSILGGVWYWRASARARAARVAS